MNNTITLKLKLVQEEQLFKTFSEFQTTPPQYAKWQLKPENCVITCYTSGKTVFQGKDANVYAAAFMQGQDEIPNTATTNQYPQAGSDEVGTGDYFGPVCVCASYVTHDDVDFLIKLGVRDSKQMSDADMLKIGPLLMERIPHSLLIVLPQKYNRVHESNNLNAIKAKLHNQAYINLAKKIELPSFKIIDQFTPETSYYRYLKNEPQIIRGIHFETKAEDKYLSVAVGSIISRYGFLKTWEEMEKKYNMTLPKGSGDKVDIVAQAFVERYGLERLGEIAKLHFKNTEKIRV
ncbi:MAG: ribonuclease HIII [Solobacterium sp.]|uniref:ribonuclease HIII n=1 Tax=Solobacterium sp. TaxID=2060878 RepID=UPI001CB2EE7D|nr:ribonuclease HIII [Solobacterium sp.]MBF1085664.1 ribonuclease HIII [Solobacterium sp.]MBF1118479.1 ribonuclease HIII [Solobacterium sp.]